MKLIQYLHRYNKIIKCAVGTNKFKKYVYEILHFKNIINEK